MKRFAAVGLTALLTIAVVCGAEKPKAGPVNRLSKELSPYLRQHAHNPVDWHPWGAEAFAKAQKEKKLIFLSIGYSSCHWCHVMERESFANPEVAKILNASFVCIKVDREERPDVDEIYMTALQVLRQRGGWPLSMFLMPDGKPIIGGTYWPPDDRMIEGETVRGFKSILKIMIDLHKDKYDDLAKQAESVAKHTQQQLSESDRGRAIVRIDREIIDDGVKTLLAEFDPLHGGFGRSASGFRGTKFPMPSYLELLLAAARTGKNADVTKALTVTLTKMAHGGIFDQLGGGFHRYSTERTWTVPHFEKMLYDNAQLVEAYSAAYKLDPQPLYEQSVRETLGFIAREMTAPGGGFYSALDADSEGEEGRFYVWTAQDLAAAKLSADERELLDKRCGTNGEPNFEGKYHILKVNRPLDALAADEKTPLAQLADRWSKLQAKLLAARERKERPFLDTKILAAWNGQMIAGYAKAGRVFRDESYLAAARKAADFVLKNMQTKEGRLMRVYFAESGKTGEARLNAYLDDYAFVVHGLLNLHDATKEPRWLDDAKRLTDLMIDLHWDKERGGFFYTSHDHEKLFARSKDQYDGAQPSANSMAARNLVRLSEKIANAKYAPLAQKQLETFAGTLKGAPTSLAMMLVGMSDWLELTSSPQQPGLPKLPGGGGAKKSDSVVKVAVKASAVDAANKQTLTVSLEVEKDWHIYANPVENEMQESAQTEVRIAGKGGPKALKFEYPPGKKVEDKLVGSYRTYEGTVEIKVQIERAPGDKESVEVSVRLLACNDKTKVCLLPATVKLSVP